MSKVIPGFMGFASVLVFVRLLGYEQYGRYAVVFGLVMAIASTMAAWLSQGILRFQSQAVNLESERALSVAGRTGRMLSIFFGMIVLGAALYISRTQKVFEVLLSLMLFSVLLIYTLELAQCQARLQSQRVLQLEIIRSVFGFAIPIVLVMCTTYRNAETLLLGLTIGYLGPLLLKPRNHRLQAAPTLASSVDHWTVLNRLWQFGWPVALWMLCQQGFVVSDRLFLRHYSGYSEAGIYASMYYVVVRSFSLLFMPVTLAVHPLVMDHWNAGRCRQAVSTIRSGLGYQLLVFVPAAVVLVLTAPWLARLVVGKSLHNAAALVMPLVVSGFLWQTSLLAHKPLEILCQTKRMLAGIILALAINVIGNRLLVPVYGYEASACLSVGSSAGYVLMVFLLTPRKRFESEMKATESRDLKQVPAYAVAEEIPTSVR